MWRRVAKAPVRRRAPCRYSSTTDARLLQAAPTVIAQSASLLPQMHSMQPPKLSWSSPHDNVARAPFASDYVQAWSLLEACLDSSNLERAEPVFLGFAEMSSSKRDITLALNNYLLRLVNANEGQPIVAERWLNKMRLALKTKFETNTVTDAIMLKNAYNSHEETLIRAFHTLHIPQFSRILHHVEVLGVTAVRDIVSMLQIDVNTLDDGVRVLVAERPISETLNSVDGTRVSKRASDTASVETSSNTTEEIAEPIPKPGFEILKPTSSAGLRSVRHHLSGLELNAEDEQAVKMFPLLQDKDVNEKNFVNFFDMFKSTPESDRAEFEIMLNQINERRQQVIETRGVEGARIKWKTRFETMIAQDKTLDHRVDNRQLEALMWQWHQQMLLLVEEEYRKIDELANYATREDVPSSVRSAQGKSWRDRFEYGPFLRLAKAKNLPAVTMMELLRLSSVKGVTDGIRSTKAILDVGKNVELDYRLRCSKQREQEASSRSKGVSNFRRDFAKTSIDTLLRKLSLENENSAWPLNIRAKIGSLLIALFLRIAKISVRGTDPVTGKEVRGRAPAFFHTYQYKNGNKLGVLRAHKNVAQHLTGESTAAIIQPQLLPMLVEPRPWTSWNSGGYYHSPSLITRIHESPEQLAYVKAAANRETLQPVYDGLTALGKTSWTINEDMFRIISEIWNSEQALLDIPPNVSPQLDRAQLPPPPSRSEDPTLRRDHFRECRRITLENAALYSQRCDMNYKLDVARAYLGERFFLPHNLDFRGRAYPLSPHLNHMGNDISRSLMIFWRGKKLGTAGFYWLKIHAANLFGNSKSSHEERIKFIEDHMDSIIESAKNPLTGDGWWKKADDPFQFLAACIELAKAIESGCPEEYESHLTIHQDGSCNGLQHYAALGRDVEGAREVNLEGAERPQDVYTRVLEIVKQTVLNEAEAGNQAAKVLHPVLTRKVVKQTVMTHVYGVTFIGAREQIANRLHEIDSIPRDKVHEYSSYLAARVLGAVRQLFESAHKIQDWLGDNAVRISHSFVLDENANTSSAEPKKPSFMSSVIWTTPLGLPIVQPYRMARRKQVTTELQTVYIEDPYSFQGVDGRKQRTAFPPNYIHSLDATHMLMTASSCAKEGIDFAAVHDSYWTHAADIPILNEKLRQSFLELHSGSAIDDLRLEFQKRYNGLAQQVFIPMDSPEAVEILTAREKFALAQGQRKAMSLSAQFAMEKERIKQLAEGDSSPIETSLSILGRLSDENLDRLVKRGAEMRKARVLKAQKSVYKKSTEHEGSGLDKPSTEATEAEDQDPEDDTGVSADGKLLSTLAPLRIPQVPSRGEFDVKKVLDSPYFFS